MFSQKAGYSVSISKRKNNLLFRYLLVGLLNSIAGILLFLLFFRVAGAPYVFSSALTFLAWSWFGFELQRRLAFKARKSKFSFPLYILNQLVFFVLAIALMIVLVEFIGVSAELAYPLTLAATTIGLFIFSKVIIFPK
jgi:putative flippase GtrA